MFALFKKRSEKAKLEQRYKKLLKEAHQLSSVNRRLSEDKIYEATQLLKQIERSV